MHLPDDAHRDFAALLAELVGVMHAHGDAPRPSARAAWCLLGHVQRWWRETLLPLRTPLSQSR